MPHDSNPALQRLVARLAEMAQDDRTAILVELDQAKRARIEQLLAAFDRPAEMELPIDAQAALSRGFSSWLVERIAGPCSGMTDTAFRALRESAAACSAADSTSSAPRARSLLSLFARRLAPKVSS